MFSRVSRMSSDWFLKVTGHLHGLQNNIWLVLRFLKAIHNGFIRWRTVKQQKLRANVFSRHQRMAILNAMCPCKGVLSNMIDEPSFAEEVRMAQLPSDSTMADPTGENPSILKQNRE